MRYIILFEDNPKADPAIRARLMPDHLGFLEARATQILAAGPLCAATGEAAGGMWIVETATVKAAEDLIRADPFWPTGLRRSWRILEWTRVFENGQRLIKTR